MPGSANFVGEFLILLGVFKAKIVIAIIAFAGVVLACGLRAADVHPRDAQPRRGRRSTSREMSLADGVVLVPLVLAILGLALYPQLALKKGEGSVVRAVAPAQQAAAAAERAQVTP